MKKKESEHKLKIEKDVNLNLQKVLSIENAGSDDQDCVNPEMHSQPRGNHESFIYTWLHLSGTTLISLSNRAHVQINKFK